MVRSKDVIAQIKKGLTSDTWTICRHLGLGHKSSVNLQLVPSVYRVCCQCVECVSSLGGRVERWKGCGKVSSPKSIPKTVPL